MFKILVIDEDQISNKKFEAAVKSRQQVQLIFANSGEDAIDMIAPKQKDGKDAKEAKELTPSLAPDLIFLENSKITGAPKEWYENLYEALKQAGRENVPIILLSQNGDPLFIRNFLAPGVQDAFVKPMVSSILDATLTFYLEGGKETPRKIVPLKGVVEMYFQGVALEISEFEMKISTPKKIEVNDFVPLYGDFFQWSPNRRAVGRCTDCKTDELNKNFFIETFTFVGVPPGITKEVRIWLRNAYVAQKQKE